jgi:hypothetical protein
VGVLDRGVGRDREDQAVHRHVGQGTRFARTR